VDFDVGFDDGFVFGVVEDVVGVDFDFGVCVDVGVIVELDDVGVVDGFVDLEWSVSYFQVLIDLNTIMLKLLLALMAIRRCLIKFFIILTKQTYHTQNVVNVILAYSSTCK